MAGYILARGVKFFLRTLVMMFDITGERFCDISKNDDFAVILKISLIFKNSQL